MTICPEGAQPSVQFRFVRDAVATLVGIECGVVSNLESSGGHHRYIWTLTGRSERVTWSVLPSSTTWRAIATAELGGALLVSLLALAAPLAALGVIIFFLWLAIRLVRHLFRGPASIGRSETSAK